MSQQRWTDVDEYFSGLLVETDAVLDEALRASDEAGLPPHNVAPNQGKFLNLLAKIRGARSILEIGTLGAYSTIWLARALPPDGYVVTLEADPKHAEVARKNIHRAGLDHVIDLRFGPALDTLSKLKDENKGPFDLIFIDADKPNNPNYLAWALKLSRPGTVIIGDNVVRDGAVIDSKSDDPRVQGVRKFCELMKNTPNLSATALQTVGCKGWDGFSLAVVN